MNTQRVPHVLRENKRNVIPYTIIVFDTESNLRKIDIARTRHDFRLGVCWILRRRHNDMDYSKESKVFKSIDEFWSIVEANVYDKRVLWIISHNLLYDFVVLKGFDYMNDNGWRQVCYYANNLSFTLIFKKGNKTIYALSSSNWFPVSVEALGNQLGIPKLSINFETATDDELEEYCRRDAYIVAEMMNRWLKFWYSNNLGNFGLTLASCAFNAYRHRFMKHKIYIHGNPEADKLEREAYYGGRTECFHIGPMPEQTYYYLDINSMYPYVMKCGKYPTKLVDKVKLDNVLSGDKVFDDYILKGYLVVARVALDTPIPIAPKRRNGKLIFPVGRFWTVLPTPELALCFKLGLVYAVKEALIYEGDYIFKDFVDYFYKERIQAKLVGADLWSYFYKILMNSLYGKFGQLTPLWEKIGEVPKNVVFNDPLVDTTTGKRGHIRAWNGVLEQSFDRKPAYNSFVAISAHVTSYARVWLYSLMQEAGFENVYYVDTDSMILDEVGYKNILHHIDPNELGKLKLEYTFDEGIIFGPKDYKFGLTSKTKGVPKKAKNLGNNEFEIEVWPRLGRLIQYGSLNEYITEIRKKKLKRIYDKGIITPSGRVIPLEIAEF